MNRALAAMFLATFCAGCPRRLEFGPEGPLDDPRAVLSRVDAADARVQALTSEGKLTVDSPQARGTLGVFVAVARPSLLRVELFDFFGRPQGLLVVNADRFGFYSAQENRFFTGPASSENVSRFLPLELPTRELVPLLLGEAPRLSTDELGLRVSQEALAYVVRLSAGKAVQELYVHPRFFRALRSEVKGMAAYDVAFDDFVQEGDIAFPRHLVLASQAAKARLELRYSDLTLNPQPDPSLFEIVAPPDVPVLEVDERGVPVTRRW
ncbi:MAG: DUF4292 domain-containing protein [Myxococcaceae bacterium]|nr:DUF4292 domain-containing protein [Myxococcaceae bacterium]MCI0672658.1 DUF4292 domain-containing protein [Myxococcaceae bacterium]